MSETIYLIEVQPLGEASFVTEQAGTDPLNAKYRASRRLARLYGQPNQPFAALMRVVGTRPEGGSS